MKILIGLDDSKFSEDVIRSVVGQFRTENTEVLVIHVLQPVEPVAPPEMAQGYALSWKIRKSRRTHWLTVPPASCGQRDSRLTPRLR